MTPTEGRERGEKRARRGIKRAAYKHRPEIERGTLQLIDALLASPTGCATLDDATDSLREKYLDGGKWRAIDFREGDKIDRTALKALVREAIATTPRTRYQRAKVREPRGSYRSPSRMRMSASAFPSASWTG